MDAQQVLEEGMSSEEPAIRECAVGIQSLLEDLDDLLTRASKPPLYLVV